MAIPVPILDIEAATLMCSLQKSSSVILWEWEGGGGGCSHIDYLSIAADDAGLPHSESQERSFLFHPLLEEPSNEAKSN